MLDHIFTVFIVIIVLFVVYNMYLDAKIIFTQKNTSIMDIFLANKIII